VPSSPYLWSSICFDGEAGGPRSASSIDECGRRERWSHNAPVRCEGALTLFECLCRDVPRLLGILQRLHRILVHRDNVRDEIRGLTMERDDFLEGRHVREVLAELEQLLPNALELVFDRDERGHDAIAVVERRLHLGRRSGLARAPLIDGNRLQAMEEHQLRIEAGAVLFDEREEVLKGHRITVRAPTPGSVAARRPGPILREAC